MIVKWYNRRWINFNVFVKMLKQKVDGRLVRRGEDLNADKDAAAVLAEFFK